jgi:CHAT domain-containing protein
MPEGTALVQYLLSPDHLRIIVTTPTLVQDHHVSFAPTEVHRLVFRMRAALQDATDGFLEPARKLHDTLIAPVLTQLRDARIRTLALSLDGVLRYVPMAALHDGTRYLIEDFALVLTAGQSADFVPRPAGKLRACGLGVTRAIGRHPALHGVRDELLAVIRTDRNSQGLLPGDIWLDEDFTAAALAAALSGGYPVVHVSSHFAFRAAQEASSFLLLGDGSKLTVADLAQWRFDGVELMVLSACDTATGGGHGHSGREIEGLGSLARHLGARNVIATLWPVRDFTTAVFMRRFYENWYLRGLAGPEALRQAQLSLCLGRTPAAATGPDRKIVEPDDEEYMGRWDHPRFWAPYLLMGEPTAVLPADRA